MLTTTTTTPTFTPTTSTAYLVLGELGVGDMRHRHLRDETEIWRGELQHPAARELTNLGQDVTAARLRRSHLLSST